MYKPLPPIQESADELKQRFKQEHHLLKRQRLHALYLIASGQVPQRLEIAGLLGVSRNTVSQWLEQYQAGGLAALLVVRTAPGRPPPLSPAQMRALQAALAQPAGFASYYEVQQWLAAQLDGQLSYQSVHRLVHYQLGASLKVPRPSHIKKSLRPAASSN